MVNIPVEVHVASEFAYNMPVLSEKLFFIYLTQSGETADSRQVLVQTNIRLQSLTITNVKGSTLSREADYTLLLHVSRNRCSINQSIYWPDCSNGCIS